MSDSSNIEWTDATWNPVVGCSRVSAGCDHCYAVGMTRRLEGISKAGGFGLTGHRAENYRGLTIELPQAAVDRGCGVNGRHFNGEVRCVEEALDVPLRWKKPKRIFVNSMSDLFHPKVPFEFINQVFAVMALNPQHTFQVLTKRPERMAEYLRYDHADAILRGTSPRKRIIQAACNVDVLRDLAWPIPNVWLGTSCEDQAAADERIPYLLQCPAVVRFLSCEPLLGSIDLGIVGDGLDTHARSSPAWHTGIHWVIVGGESGSGALPCDVESIRSIVRQCAEASVPCFVKQLGSKPYSDTDPLNGTPMVGRVYESTGGDDFDTYRINDRKGGDPAEWPEDLRVRQMPAGGAA